MGGQDALIINSQVALYSFLGSIIPIIIWLWFWLKEDPHPEPRKILIATFMGGVLAVPVALIGEILAVEGGTLLGILSPGSLPFLLLFIWAAIEEYVKYKAAAWTALFRPGFDEPIDAPIYLVTAALGFASFENGIFLFNAFLDNTAFGIITGQLRFLGATLLHVTASGIVGISIAYSFFHKELRHRNVIGGLCTAILLHALFNFFILKQGNGNILIIFIGVWVVTIILLLFMEKIKRLRP
ncbi:MAG: PrsW family intramembrane metalloprotease [Candidatus Niyogibacteria bacterium]|nr:PrsW family intramembrane metalloprotease [Candidatus Niyogibacteria bacterium]